MAVRKDSGAAGDSGDPSGAHSDVTARYLDACRMLYEIGTAAGNKCKEQAGGGRAAALEALMTVLKDRAPVPDWLASAVVESWRRFQRFEVPTLGEAFGMSDVKHMAARRGDLLCGALAGEVQQLQREGLPLKDNANTRGALSLAGERFNMSAKSVEARVRRWHALEARAAHEGAAPDDVIAYCEAAKVRDEQLLRSGRLVRRVDVAAANNEAVTMLREMLSEMRPGVVREVKAAQGNADAIAEALRRMVSTVMDRLQERMSGSEWGETVAHKLAAEAIAQSLGVDQKPPLKARQIADTSQRKKKANI